MKRATCVLALMCCASSILAQPRGGILRVRLINGSTGEAGTADSVTLLRLGGEMIPVKELGAVSGSFEITDIEVEGERPMLLQVNVSGVNYNQPVQFGRGYEAEAEVTVYDTFGRWDEQALSVTTSRFLYRREGESLLVDKVYVIDNRSSPPATYHDPEGTFRFNLPSDNLIEMGAITASSALGVPVPQPASPLPDGSGYVTKTAFKPGETQIAISYELRYDEAGHEVAGQAFLPLSELLVFVAPPDIETDAPGWEDLGVEPQGRFSALRMRDLDPGSPIRFKLSGGSRQSPPLVSSEGGEAASGSRGTVTRIPDTTRSSKWALVILMGAALGYGLLSTLWPAANRRG